MSTMPDKEIRYNAYHMRNAINASLMSHSREAKVGAVIVRDNRTIIDGWNGTPSGHSNVCEHKELSCVCGKVFTTDMFIHNTGTNLYTYRCSCATPTTLTADGLLAIPYETDIAVCHAEENTILYAAKRGIPLDGTTLYVTMMPCEKCSKMIKSVGMKKVYYLDTFKRTSGLDMLHRLGVTTVRIHKDGETYNTTP